MNALVGIRLKAIPTDEVCNKILYYKTQASLRASQVFFHASDFEPLAYLSIVEKA